MPRWRIGETTANLSLSIGPSSANVPVQEITSFGGVSVTLDFSKGDQISFSVPGRSVEAAYMDELASDVWLTSAINQRFRIINIGQDWGEDGSDDIAVTAVSYKRLLNQRHVGPGGLEFTAIDQGDIVWGLIAHTQARPGGSWGVTKGSSTTGVVRDRAYVEGDNLGNLAENLQNVIDGLYWDINSSKVYSARLPTQFLYLAQPLQLGVNVRNMQRVSAASGFANVAYGDASQETTTPVWAEAADVATDPRGRWERAFGWPTVTQQDVLDEHTHGALQEANTPPAAWTVELEPARWLVDSHFLPGDFGELVVPPTTAAPVGGAGSSVSIQVTETAVSFNADGALEVKLAAVERNA